MTRSMRLLRGAQGLVCSRTPGYLANRPFPRNIRRYSDYVPTGTTSRTTVNTLPFSSSIGKGHKSSEWVDVPPSGATVQVGTGLVASSTDLAFSSVIGSDGPHFSNLLLRDSCKYKPYMTSAIFVGMRYCNNYVYKIFLSRKTLQNFDGHLMRSSSRCRLMYAVR